MWVSPGSESRRERVGPGSARLSGGTWRLAITAPSQAITPSVERSRPAIPGSRWRERAHELTAARTFRSPGAEGIAPAVDWVST